MMGGGSSSNAPAESDQQATVSGERPSVSDRHGFIRCSYIVTYIEQTEDSYFVEVEPPYSRLVC